MPDVTGEVCTCRFRPWPDPEQEDHEIDPGCPRHGDDGDLEDAAAQDDDGDELPAMPHGLDPGQVC